MDLPVTENTEFLILEGFGLAKADAEPWHICRDNPI